MKKYLIFALIVMLFVGCSKKRNITLLNSSDFETVIDGKGVSLYTLKSGFLTMQVTNYGGRVVSLWVPDNSGSYDDVVLGYENINRYVNNEGERFLGAAVGRCANRIGGGSFSIDGKMFETFKNDNGNTCTVESSVSTGLFGTLTLSRKTLSSSTLSLLMERTGSRVTWISA